MSYIDKNLLPDENIIFRTKKHPIVFMTPIILLLCALFFCLDNTITTTINSALDFISHLNPSLAEIHRWPALIFLVLALLSAISPALLYITSDYVVTNKRIIMRQGFFEKLTRDMRLSTISLVTVDQGPLAQMLNYGNIAINSFGGTDYFTLISKPNVFQNSVHSLMDKR